MDSNQNLFPRQNFKVVLVGDSGVGKSSLINCDDPSYFMSAQPTNGMDFRTRTFHVEESLIRLQIWDTPDQDKFSTIKSFVYRRTHALIRVYDITNRESFENVMRLKDDAMQECHEQVMLVLVGNKCDLKSERNVSYEEASKFAEEQGMKYVECSAKTNYGVANLCENLAKDMKHKADQGLDLFTTLMLYPKPESRKPELCCII